MSPEPATQYHHHGRLRVSGGVIPDAITAYRTPGNPANPCIVSRPAMAENWTASPVVLHILRL